MSGLRNTQNGETPRLLTRSRRRLLIGSLVLWCVGAGLLSGIFLRSQRGARDATLPIALACLGMAVPAILGFRRSAAMIGVAEITVEGLHVRRADERVDVPWADVRKVVSLPTGSLEITYGPAGEVLRWTSAELGVEAETAAQLIRGRCPDLEMKGDQA